MSRKFTPATAEQVASAAEAVVAFGRPVDAQSVANFTDLTSAQANSALELAADLGLLSANAGAFSLHNPICNMLRTPQEKERAAVLRILLEQYEPYRIFKRELEATADASEAAARTRSMLELDAHREEIKDTLLSLATYSGALVASHGGRYESEANSISSLMKELFAGCQEAAAAAHHVRKELGNDVANIVSHNDVLTPLSTALRYAIGSGSREAVLHAGNAVDTFLNEWATRVGVNFAGATGINSKLDKLRAGGKIPKKLLNVGKFLGHVRNAADHGADPDIGVAWTIQNGTGINYVTVSIAFIRSARAHETGRHEL